MNLLINNRKHVLSKKASEMTDGSKIIIYPQGCHSRNERVMIDVKDPGAALLLCQLLSESIVDEADVSISVSATQFIEKDGSHDA